VLASTPRPAAQAAVDMAVTTEKAQAMAHRSLLPESVDQYLRTVVARETPLQQRLRAETTRLPMGGMQIGADQGVLLAFLIRLIGARNAIEVGTFTGFSALAIARGLGPAGRLLCLDVSEAWTAVARRFWAKAGVADRIELRLGPAAETLRTLPEGPSFDFAFIDADKKGYPVYWEEVVRRLRPGGLVAVDNVLWEGEVVRPEERGEDVEAIRRFNELVLADPRVESVMLAVADGLTLARRLP